MKTKKRRGITDPIFGVVKPLPSLQLPLYRDVGKAVALKMDEMKEEIKGKSNDIVFESVSKEIAEIYERASVPTINLKNIKLKVKNLWQKRREQMVDKQGNKKK